jgi:hypothetical protein
MKIEEWNGATITSPGVYSDVPLDIYHSQEICDGPSVSSTGLRRVLERWRASLKPSPSSIEPFSRSTMPKSAKTAKTSTSGHHSGAPGPPAHRSHTMSTQKSTEITILERPSQLLAPQLDYILLDGSGSMMAKWWDTMAAIDSFVGGLKAANLNDQVILSTFCSINMNCVQRNSLLKDFEPLVQSPVGAYFGGTPLYDAIALTGRQLRELNPNRAHVLIATDGQEADSCHTDDVKAKSIIRWMRSKGWAVTFIGSGFDNSEAGRALGLDEESCIGVSPKLLEAAASALAEKRKRHYHTGEPMHWSAEERTQFGGYLGKS